MVALPVEFSDPTNLLGAERAVEFTATCDVVTNDMRWVWNSVQTNHREHPKSIDDCKNLCRVSQRIIIRIFRFLILSRSCPCSQGFIWIIVDFFKENMWDNKFMILATNSYSDRVYVSEFASFLKCILYSVYSLVYLTTSYLKMLLQQVVSFITSEYSCA